MSRQKREVLDELIEEIRRSQNATDRYDDAVAESLGINPTDLRCLDEIQRAGQLTAGHLAEKTGLTTGAITAVLDRLERVGLARRVRDTSDRRRVLLEVTERSNVLCSDLFAPHIAKSEELFRNHTQAELELILGFLRESSDLNEEQAARLEQRNREAKGSA